MALATVADFPWAGDIGVPSIDGLDQLCRSSGFTYRISSAYRSTSTTYHGKHNAIDVVSSVGTMKDLAAYLKGYAPYLLELIHSGGDGYFVKNGKVVGRDFYADEIPGHYDHVHVASTLTALAAASISARPDNGPAEGNGSGCLSVILMGAGSLATVATLIATHLHLPL